MRRGLVIIGAALALCGCADLGATTTATTTTRPSKVAIADRTHEYPAAPAPTETVAGSGAPAAEEAIREFATAYINWTAGSVARDMLVLAAESVGQARSATELAASETASDYELRRGGVANSGTVQAVAPLAAGGGRFVVVTLERTTATNTNAYAGLAPAWHVTVASATELARGRWVVSGWQPEN